MRRRIIQLIEIVSHIPVIAAYRQFPLDLLSPSPCTHCRDTRGYCRSHCRDRTSDCGSGPTRLHKDLQSHCRDCRSLRQSRARTRPRARGNWNYRDSARQCGSESRHGISPGHAVSQLMHPLASPARVAPLASPALRALRISCGYGIAAACLPLHCISCKRVLPVPCARQNSDGNDQGGSYCFFSSKSA
jgi:hypothetical protein